MTSADQLSDLLRVVWLDRGELTVGADSGLLRQQTFLELSPMPIAAAVACNQEFDDGVNGSEGFAAVVTFRLLSADGDAGLPAATVIDAHGAAIGATHPVAHELASARSLVDG